MVKKRPNAHYVTHKILIYIIPQYVIRIKLHYSVFCQQQTFICGITGVTPGPPPNNTAVGKLILCDHTHGVTKTKMQFIAKLVKAVERTSPDCVLARLTDQFWHVCLNLS